LWRKLNPKRWRFGTTQLGWALFAGFATGLWCERLGLVAAFFDRTGLNQFVTGLLEFTNSFFN